MISLKLSALFGLLFAAQSLWAHAGITGPAPRNSISTIKIAPCGGSVRSATPTLVQGGQMMTVTWDETVNHPGKFIFSLSMANDTNFSVLKQVVDTMNGTNDLPHRYTTQVAIPDINCDTCTLQMIQSMEENASAPTFYYSCTDLKIIGTAAPGTTTTNPVTQQGGAASNTTAPNASFGGGCGLVKSVSSDDKNDGGKGLFMLLAVLPLACLAMIRRREFLKS